LERATARRAIERRASFGRAEDARSTYTGIELSEPKVRADAWRESQAARMGRAGD